MSTQFPEIWNALAAEFPAAVVKQRPAGGGRQVRFVTARTVMNRLDHVLGFENWFDRYEHDPAGSDNITCLLTVRLPDGREITKSDSGAPGSTGDDGDDEKGAFSDAFKRAAVKFGVGRYLYGEGVWIEPPNRGTHDSGPGTQVAEDPVPAPDVLRLPPAEPALSHHEEAVRISREHARRNREMRAPAAPGTDPRTGRQLYAWSKDKEQQFGVGMCKYLETWGLRQGFSGRMVSWTEAQVKLAYNQAIHKLEGVQPAYVREQAAGSR